MLRINRWKVVFAEQRNKGMGVWREPFSMMPRAEAASFTIDQVVKKLMPRT